MVVAALRRPSAASALAMDMRRASCARPAVAAPSSRATKARGAKRRARGAAGGTTGPRDYGTRNADGRWKMEDGGRTPAGLLFCRFHLRYSIFHLPSCLRKDGRRDAEEGRWKSGDGRWKMGDGGAMF